MLRKILLSSLVLIQSCRTTFVDPDHVHALPPVREDPPILVIASWDPFSDENPLEEVPETAEGEHTFEVKVMDDANTSVTAVQPTSSSVKLVSPQQEQLMPASTVEDRLAGQDDTVIILTALTLLALCVILAPAK